jgi:hypothetical protein
MPGLIWSQTEALSQPENTDPAFSPYPSAPGQTAADLSIFIKALGLASNLLRFPGIPGLPPLPPSPPSPLPFVANFFTFLQLIVTDTQSAISNTKAAIADAQLHAYLDNLKYLLVGINDNLRMLSELDPGTPTYGTDLIAVNTSITLVMPQF